MQRPLRPQRDPSLPGQGPGSDMRRRPREERWDAPADRQPSSVRGLRAETRVAGGRPSGPRRERTARRSRPWTRRGGPSSHGPGRRCGPCAQLTLPAHPVRRRRPRSPGAPRTSPRRDSSPHLSGAHGRTLVLCHHRAGDASSTRIETVGDSAGAAAFELGAWIAPRPVEQAIERVVGHGRSRAVRPRRRRSRRPGPRGRGTGSPSRSARGRGRRTGRARRGTVPAALVGGLAADVMDRLPAVVRGDRLATPSKERDGVDRDEPGAAHVGEPAEVEDDVGRASRRSQSARPRSPARSSSRRARR
jgi:hypothetical protein